MQSLQFLTGIYHDYRMFIAAIVIGASVVGGLYTFLHGNKVPEEQRGAYTLMSIYSLIIAAGLSFVLLRNLLPLH